MKTKVLLTVTALVLLAGCQKFGVGTAIRFTAETRLDAAGTKAAYSDVVTSNIERIDWKAGDQIKLAMRNAENPTSTTQDYNITGITADGYNSKAGLETDGGGSGLEWGTGDHYFWAAYPSTATLGSGSMTVTGTIAGTQEQRYTTTNSGIARYDSDQTLYLTAGKLVDAATASTGDPISLDFDPAMTTFDFEVGSNTEDDLMIRSFELTTEYAESEVADANLRALSGGFTATYNVSMVRTLSTTAATTLNRSITVNFSSQPALSQTKKVRFRVMALPQTIQGLTVVFNTTETDSGAVGATINKIHKLRLKQSGSWITFPACGKANITGLLIPGAEWKITFSGPRVQQWTVYDEVVIGVE